MTRVILDPATSAKLDRLAERVEVCDATGRTLGFFIPVVDRTLYEDLDVPISEDELKRREQESERYSTQEVIAHLQNLEKA
jgi:hypothetical protein